MRAVRERLRHVALSPAQYFTITCVALATQAMIVLTGSAVRLTGSGLGCPTWPECYKNGRVAAELNTHAVIEFANRSLASGIVTLAALAAAAGVFFVRPARPDLRVLAFV